MGVDHCGFITRLQNVRPHENADSLQLCTVFNNQVVISKDMNEGDLIFYVPTDMQLGKEFCEANKLLRSLGGFIDDDKRNVKCIKLRGERSDGIILPVKCLEGFTDVSELKAGDRISVLNGVQIVQKYVPKHKPKYSVPKHHIIKHKAEELKKKYPLFAQHCETEQLDYNMDVFQVGDEIIITEKCHGTSGRTSHNDAIVDVPQNWLEKKINKLLRKGPEKEKRPVYVSGTRRTIMGEFEGKDYYGTDAFRKVIHDDFEQKDKLHYGEEIFYEIVGYVDKNTTIMPSCANSKVKDKEFSKMYGEQTNFTYGCEPGQSDIYVYRMTFTNKDGYTIEYPWDLVKLRCDQMGLKTVPELDRFMFTSKEDLLSRVDAFLDMPSTIDGRHVSEGVCVRRNNSVGFSVLKKKSYYFKCLEGLIKDAGIADIEEQESAVVEEGEIA